MKVRQAEKELKVLTAKLRHYEDLGFSIGSPMGSTGNQHSGTSRVELAAIGAVDALQAVWSQQRELMAIIARAEAIIRNIPQEKYRALLNYHYICGWSMRSVSDELGYKDPNTVYRARGWALWEAQQVMKKMEAAKNGQTVRDIH